MRKYLMILTMFGTLISCSGQDYQSVVEKFDTYDFSPMEGFGMVTRSQDPFTGTKVIMVSRTEDNCGPYVITYSIKDDRIISINSDLVIKGCGANNISEYRIVPLVENYLRVGVPVLSVYSSGNVLMNPFYIAPPIMARCLSKNCKNLEQKGFKQFVEHWAIKK